MAQENKKFETKKIAPWILLGIAGVGLSFFANPAVIKNFLWGDIKNVFGDLVEYSNEKVEVEELLSSVPDGEEQTLAGWFNTAVRKESRAISKGRIKPHHVLLDVLRGAASVYNRKK